MANSKNSKEGFSVNETSDKACLYTLSENLYLLIEDIDDEGTTELSFLRKGKEILKLNAQEVFNLSNAQFHHRFGRQK